MNDRSNVGQTQWASGLNLLAGLWAIVSPWVLGYSGLGTPTTNAVIVGIIVAVLAAIHAFSSQQSSWLSWVNAVLGLWLLVSPFILGFTGSPQTNDVIVGIIMIVLGVWGAMASREVVA